MPNHETSARNDDLDTADFIRDAQETADDAFLLRRYKVVQMIGSGNYSRVYKCLTNSGKEIAIKSINMTKNSENYTKKFLPRELAVLKKVNHVNICRTHEIIQIADRIYVLMPFCQRGTIADLLMKSGPLSENVARYLFTQVLDAIVYLHGIEIAHRDVKVENILLTSDFVPKLTDFSYSTFTNCQNLAQKSLNNANNETRKSSMNLNATNNNQATSTSNNNANAATAKTNTTQANDKTLFRTKQDSPRSIKQTTIYHRQSALIKTLMNRDGIRLNETFCGTLPYLAPEVIRLSSYDARKVDVWSLGVCLFVMLNDKLPFAFTDLKKMVRKQTTRDYKFRAGHEPAEQLRDFVALMFEPDYTKRMDSRELSRHPWLVGPMEKPNVT